MQYLNHYIVDHLYYFHLKIKNQTYSKINCGQVLQILPPPAPLAMPVQALDHATGYLLATAALRGIQDRVRFGHGSIMRVSLARTGVELMRTLGHPAYEAQPLDPVRERDFEPDPENTFWGPALRARWPIRLQGMNAHWRVPAGPLGQSAAQWAIHNSRS